MATRTKAAAITEEQKVTALAHARRSLKNRRSYAADVRRNSFSEWGNDSCISRTIDTIRAMESGHATDAQYRYWLNH